MTDSDMVHWTWIFRIAERGTLTLFMVAITISLLAVLRNKRMSLKVEPGGKLPVGTVTIAVALPVVIFLIFGGYTYISLTNRIEIAAPAMVDPRQQVTIRGFDDTAGGASPAGSPRASEASDITRSLSTDLELYDTILLDKTTGNPTAIQAQHALSMALKAVCVVHYGATPEFADFPKFVGSHEIAEISNALNSAVVRLAPRDVLCQSVKDQVR